VSGRLAAVAFKVTTSATVATRYPVVRIEDGTATDIASTVSGYAATANTTATIVMAEGLSEWDQANDQYASGPIARVPLVGGDRIVITLANGQSADTITNVRIVILQDAVPGMARQDDPYAQAV